MASREFWVVAHENGEPTDRAMLSPIRDEAEYACKLMNKYGSETYRVVKVRVEFDDGEDG